MTDNTERGQVGWSFWLEWVWASTVVLALGVTVGAVGIFIGALIGVVFGGTGVLIGVLIGAAFGSVFGILLGVAQRYVLRRHVSWSERWSTFSAVGGAASFAIAVAIIIAFVPFRLDIVFGSFGADLPAEIVLGIVIAFGASLGIAQWFVLRRKVSGSGLWVLASAAGPALIYLVVFSVTMFTLDRNEAVLLGVVGAVLGYGAITGDVLARLLRPPEEAEPRALNALLEKLRLGLDMSNRPRLRIWLLVAASFLIVLIAVYFLFATIMVDEPIVEIQVPPCSEAEPGSIVTCRIERAYCSVKPGSKTTCYDAPIDSRSFILQAFGLDLSDFAGGCLLVTGEVVMEGEIPKINVDNRLQVEFCR